MKAIHCTGRITMLRTLLRSRSAPKSLKIPRRSSSVTIPFTFARGRLCNTSEAFGAACVSLAFHHSALRPRTWRRPGLAPASPGADGTPPGWEGRGAEPDSHASPVNRTAWEPLPSTQQNNIRSTPFYRRSAVSDTRACLIIHALPCTVHG